MALIDHGVHRTGKEGSGNKAMVGGADLCGPDQHAIQAKERIRRRHASSNSPALAPYDWAAVDRDYADMGKIERRKNRGGANFSPGDCC